VNRNDQVNLGRTNMRGTNPTNWFYKMRCQKCLHEYLANGSDIFQKKCPACQGGADTGAK
jgi:ribosomal protein S27E